VFFIGTNTRERMNVFKTFEWLCCNPCLMFFKGGKFESNVERVLSLEKYLLRCGSSRGFGQRGF
jgi:hypothetical protein